MTTYSALRDARARCAYAPTARCDPRRLVKRLRTIWLLISCLALAACSIQRIATRGLSETLTSGDSIFESDNDPVLIGEALPLALKVIETLISKDPRNVELLLAAARGYALYTYVTVDLEEERIRLDDIAAARALRLRARNLYLRAHGYALRALAVDHPDIEAALHRAPEAAAATLTGTDAGGIAALYWSAATLGLAISTSRTDPALLARLPEVEALLQRALALDESWGSGTLHEFAISFAAASPAGGDPVALEAHFHRALELSNGTRASLFVAYAEAVALPAQDREQFVALLDQALAVDPDIDSAHRLLNVIAQRRAALLRERVEQLFL